MQFEELVRRALAASERAGALRDDSRRILTLAKMLRDASTGQATIARCAWCGKFEIGDEWLCLEAIGRGQQHIAGILLEGATHGICPACFTREQDAAERARARRAS